MPNRRLAAIMFTDIVGYSTLMRDDERRAVEARKRHRAVFDTLTPKYGGRILQYYGDGTLSIFNSSVAAVECAVEMQREFGKDPKVPLRIGIHTGDITYDDIDLFGDGVNIAARIEPCCIAGGIFLTGRVYSDIRNHDWLSARALGAFTFKGIDEAIDLYAVDNEGVAVPSEDDIHRLQDSDAKLVSIQPASRGGVPEKMRHLALLSIPILLLGLIVLNLSNRLIPAAVTPVDGETSIAVLPFANFSEDSTNTYFSDGITDDILTLLSHIEGLKVVSRTSAMQYRQTEKGMRQIGRELNADHILEGSVRRDGDNVRIIAQLIDTRSDQHIWAKRYDEEIDQIFDVQNKVANDIATALRKELSERERRELAKKPTDNLEAYEYYLKGRDYYLKYTPEANDRAIELFDRALDADPGFAQAYAGLADALAQKAYKSESRKGLIDSAIAMSTRAINLDAELSDGYKARGLAYHYRGDYDRALEEYKKAVERNPNNSMAINNISAIFLEKGHLLEAIRWSRRGFKISPQYNWSRLNLAHLYYAVGKDVESMTLLRGGVEHHATFLPFHELMVHLYLRRDELAAAKERAIELIAQDSDAPIGYMLLGELALFEGELEDARMYFREAAVLGREAPEIYDPVTVEMGLAYIELHTGKEALGRTRLQALLKNMEAKALQAGKGNVQMGVSMAYALLGDREEALAWLEEAVAHHWYDFRMARRHPFYEKLHDDPRFQELIREMERQVQELQQKVDALLIDGLMTLEEADNWWREIG